MSNPVTDTRRQYHHHLKLRQSRRKQTQNNSARPRRRAQSHQSTHNIHQTSNSSQCNKNTSNTNSTNNINKELLFNEAVSISNTGHHSDMMLRSLRTIASRRNISNWGAFWTVFNSLLNWLARPVFGIQITAKEAPSLWSCHGKSDNKQTSTSKFCSNGVRMVMLIQIGAFPEVALYALITRFFGVPIPFPYSSTTVPFEGVAAVNGTKIDCANMVLRQTRKSMTELVRAEVRCWSRRAFFAVLTLRKK